jgi:hypothetical protein
MNLLDLMASETSGGKTSPASSRQMTTPSAVSWARLSEQMTPSYRHQNQAPAQSADTGDTARSSVDSARGGLTSVWLPGQAVGRHGGFSTLNTSDWPNDAAVCSLSQILEPGPIPQRFYLSPRACAGILRRAEKRGKELPAMLRQALESVAHSGGRRVSGPVEVGACLTANGGGQAMDFEVETFLVEAAHAFDARQSDVIQYGDITGPLDTDGHTIGIAHALRGEGFDASEDGTGRGTPLVPVAFAIQERAVSENPDAGPDGMGVREGVAYTLEARENVQAVAYDLRGREGGAQFEGPHDTANLRAASGGSSRSYVATRWAVRRLTPTECERLQGFQDGHTAIPWRGKPADQCPDGPRYKALGNSMAVPVMAWIGRRLDAELRKVMA